MTVDRDKFIKAMRCVAHSVTVVTTDGKAGRHGATVSAFCSVSADPPSALVCLNKASKITEAVLENGEFNINVLPDDAKEIANRFAGAHDKTVSDRFDGIELADTALPRIVGATIFKCTVDQAVLSGSHHVVIGKVEKVEQAEIKPLTYFEGAYHTIAPIDED